MFQPVTNTLPRFGTSRFIQVQDKVFVTGLWDETKSEHGLLS